MRELSAYASVMSVPRRVRMKIVMKMKMVMVMVITTAIKFNRTMAMTVTIKITMAITIGAMTIARAIRMARTENNMDNKNNGN